MRSRGSAIAGALALLYGTRVGGTRTDAWVPLSVDGFDRVLVPLKVVHGLPSWAYPRGGICVGNTFLTGPIPSSRVLKHESRHALQWEKHGLTMPFRYWFAGSDPLKNRFEIEAGLEDGGYQ